MAATHIFVAPPEGVAADWTMPQNWAAFTAEQHATWRTLFDRQSAALDGYACRSSLDGLDILRKLNPGVPDFAELNALLKPASGWEIVAVPGWIPNQPFFEHLANKRFPAANFLRRNGVPVDAVERFHLANGARLERLNWMGDPSKNGVRRSLHR